MPALPRSTLALIWLSLAASLCVGIFARGYWTPDEPREADLAWRMSWQSDKAVPFLAGEAFCEKPPLAYWLAGAAIAAWGADPWVARLPNLLYALVTALAVGWIARRSAGPVAGVAAAAAVSSFLLSYQAAIWLATDAPLVAAVAAALAGLYAGFYARGTGERLRGYTCMHLALAAGFLSKSAAAWMVPTLTFAALVTWERRWRELLRWELYVGLLLQAALILGWVWTVHAGPDGPLRLKIFFWNNLVGRFAHVDAPQDLQYATGHRNTPGKYFIELPLYLCPWTLLVAAAVRQAWRQRTLPQDRQRTSRFAIAAFVPALCVLSVAATARNIYLAPALPAVALLLGGWAAALTESGDPWDRRAICATAVLLIIGAMAFAAGAAVIGFDSGTAMRSPALFVAASALGIGGAVAGSVGAWRDARRRRPLRALLAMLLAYCALLVGPAAAIYGEVDAWQNLAAIGRAIGNDAAGRPLILVAPDETTRAFIDMYTRTSVELLPGPTAPSQDRLKALIDADPRTEVVMQLPGRSRGRALAQLADRWRAGGRIPAAPPDDDALPPWAADASLRIARRYALPNGRRYALLAREAAAASR